MDNYTGKELISRGEN